MANPTGKGGFRKGASGNPKGRKPLAELADVRALSREHTREAISGLVAIARDKKMAAAARVSAWSAVLDRGWGKPAQPVTGEGGTGPAVIQVVTGISRED